MTHTNTCLESMNIEHCVEIGSFHLMAVFLLSWEAALLFQIGNGKGAMSFNRQIDYFLSVLGWLLES